MAIHAGYFSKVTYQGNSRKNLWNCTQI